MTGPPENPKNKEFYKLIRHCSRLGIQFEFMEPSNESAQTGNNGSRYARMLGSGKHADFEIDCHGHNFQVHKAILSAGSDFFNRMCDNGVQEGIEAKMSMEDEPGLVARMLLFLYVCFRIVFPYCLRPRALLTFGTQTGSYPVQLHGTTTTNPVYGQFTTVEDKFNSPDFPTTWGKEARIHTLMYAAATYYGIQPLKNDSKKHFIQLLYQESVSVPLDSGEGGQLRAADNAVASGVERKTTKKNSRAQDTDGGAQDTKARLVRLIYATTPAGDRGLRDIVVHHMQLIIREKGLQSLVYQELIKDEHDFAYDLALHRFGDQGPWKCTKCQALVPVLHIPCRCGPSTQCKNDDCLDLMEERSFCTKCFGLGTLQATK